MSKLSFLDYLISKGKDNERFDFDNNDDAYEFGTRLRKQIEEQGDSAIIDVSISNSVVRAKCNEHAIESAVK